MSNQQRNVTDIISLDYLQSVQDSLGNLTGITTALLDPNGYPISNPTNLHSFCAMMQASETGIQMCMVTNSKLIDINKETKDTAVVTCVNSGLKTAAVPIFLKDEFLGSWLIGQIRMENIDYDLIESSSTKAGLSIEQAKQNISNLPTISELEFENILNFLVTITKALTDMVLVNNDLNEKNIELKVATEKLDNSLSLLTDFFDETDVLAYMVDFETDSLLMYNQMYFDYTEVKGETILGKNGHNLLTDKGFIAPFDKLKLIDKDGNPEGFLIEEFYNEKLGVWFSGKSRAVRWADGKLAIMTTIVDVDAQKKEEERMALLAYYDQSLNIYNAIKLSLDLKENYDNRYLIFLNVKGLKEINNVYGRKTGDDLLVSIVEWIDYNILENYTLYRVMGDDFAIRVENQTKKEVMAVAKMIHERFEIPWIISSDGIEQSVFTGAHMGITAVNNSVDSYADLLSLAERVLSFARSSLHPLFFDESMNSEYQERMRFLVSLKSCVLNHLEGFSLNYQPVVDSKSERWVGLEALCRWTSPEFGPVRPDIFIQEAEKTGLMELIGDWVLEESISQVKKWKLDEIDDFHLSVNLSPVQLQDIHLFQKIDNLTKKYDYPVEKLFLEITESSEIQFNDETMEKLNKIHDTGIKFALDDFGTGYATFTNLRNLPIDVLKTDRSFLNGIEDDKYLQHTIRIMVDFAHSAGLIVTAEGVENEEQRKIIADNKVELIQGFFYSKPLSSDDIENNLQKFI